MYSLKYFNRGSFFYTALVLAMLFSPLLWFISTRLKKYFINKLLLVLIGILFVILSLEPGQMIKGPVFLMNDTKTCIAIPFWKGVRYITEVIWIIYLR